MPFYLPNGMVVVNEIQRVVREQLDAPRLRGDPHAAPARRRALEALGPLRQLPREHVLHAVGDEHGRQFAVKPMNCPGACLVFASERHSYRDLPLRLARVRPLHAQRARGRAARPAARARVHPGRRARVLHRGPDRAARCATSPRRSTSCTRCSGSTTCASSCRRARRSRSAPTSSGETAERALAQALEEMGREYQLNPGDGAFYGPKIDFHITDALGRSWQCGTCQLDFFMPRALRPHLHGRRTTRSARR